jgi:archaellin
MSYKTVISLFTLLLSLIACQEEEKSILIEGNTDIREVDVNITNADSLLFTALMDEVHLTTEVRVNGKLDSKGIIGTWIDGEGNVIKKEENNITGKFELSLSNLPQEFHTIVFGVSNLKNNTKFDTIVLNNRPYLNFEHLAVGQKSTFTFDSECTIETNNHIADGQNIQLKVSAYDGSAYTITETKGLNTLNFQIKYNNKSSLKLINSADRYWRTTPDIIKYPLSLSPDYDIWEIGISDNASSICSIKESLVLDCIQNLPSVPCNTDGLGNIVINNNDYNSLTIFVDEGQYWRATIVYNQFGEPIIFHSAWWWINIWDHSYTRAN